MAHGEDSCDEEGFVADFREDDHEEGLEDGLRACGGFEVAGPAIQGLHYGVKVEHWFGEDECVWVWRERVWIQKWVGG